MRKFRWQELYDALYAVYGECGCPLLHDTPFQLLVAVVLSAQCRDERVNVVTRSLFSRFPDPETFAKAPRTEIEEEVKTLGLYRAKAANLCAAAARIVEVYHGKVPQTMEELLTLPGVGRKSANVLLGNAFGKPGFPADTHVIRLLNLLGMVKSRDPVQIERTVNAEVEPRFWTNFSHLLIQHGRLVCHARNPECCRCTLAEHCPAARAE